MDKIFSTRIDEGIIYRINMLSNNLKLSKKAIIENAIKLYSERIQGEKETDIFDKTCGAWKREDSPEKLTKEVRNIFRNSMMRNQK